MNSPIVAKYLQDLATLAAVTAPHEGVIDDMLVDVAIYLRQDARKMRQMLDKQYVSLLEDLRRHHMQSADAHEIGIDEAERFAAGPRCVADWGSRRGGACPRRYRENRPDA